MKKKLFLSLLFCVLTVFGIVSVVSAADLLEQIQEKDLPILVERALKEANPLYPVPKIMDKKDCEAVIRRLMK